MIPNRRPQMEENTDSWLMSYADMITLLMCFFIIFVSVSEPKNDKFAKITQGLANKFGSVDLSTPFVGVYQALQGTIEANKVLKDVAIEKTEKSVLMELSSDAFFKKDTAEIDESKEQVLAEMVGSLKQVDFLDFRVTIEGYTNNIPTANPIYPSNWELSSARAARIVRFFADHGVDPRRLKAVGFGDTKPSVPNTDSRGNAIPENQAKNQRIMIKIEREM